jgi:hypothetical protein
MLKSLALGVNVLLLFFFTWIKQDNGVSIEINFPDKGFEGQEIPMSITVMRASAGAPCRLEMKLDEGMKVLDGENAGGSFRMEEQTAIWSWKELTDSARLTITAALFLAEHTGTQKVEAVFYYENGSEKKETEAVARYVDVSPAQSAGVEPAAEISATRRIATAGNECIVTVTIHKDATKGFARFSDDLPPAWNVRALKQDGASFSVADGKIRFVWVTAPDKPDLEISYAVKAPAGEMITFRGEYAYLEKNKSLKLLLPPDSLRCSAITEEPAVATVDKSEKSSRNKRKKDRREIPVTAPAGVVYHVQIGAFRNKKVSAARLKKLYRLNETIHSEMQDGLYKFYAGVHTDYRRAYDHRERAKSENGIASAFVIARNAGKRITVREALDITRQQWYR